uniref:Uncharacterized protein n=1 Tax=Candidatus Kentrum sp. LPFa TaxID=2126335 RepID=A0A450WYP7_9GAMM|nr:MAG: hypothetical protein BECKLPF1236B_GA0070989_12953 [Candidatus Kentron sp. LPFa]
MFLPLAPKLQLGSAWFWKLPPPVDHMRGMFSNWKLELPGKGFPSWSLGTSKQGLVTSAYPQTRTEAES